MMLKNDIGSGKYDKSCTMDDVKMTEDYKAFGKIWDELDKEITAKFGRDENFLDLFERYKAACDNCCAEEVIAYFEAGIKLGIKLGLELA